ncbi:MAG: 4-phosphoerythronate dehydrogenase [Cellvibrionaceae bacterium]
MKIIADENIPLVEEYFGTLGQVVTLPGRTISAEDVRDADALIVRSVTQVNEALLSGSSVKFVGTCTIGIDHLDTQWLDSQIIAWASAPGCNANSVVEYIFSALAALNVDWRQKRFGIIGCGNVGGALYRRLTALGLHCDIYDPLLDQKKNPSLTELDVVLQNDIVCCHAPLTKTGDSPSFHLLNKDNLSQLKKNAVLINAGRGAVIDNNALLQLLDRRADLTVVLDVWEGEPKPLIPLLDKVQLATPHIAGYSFDGKEKGTEMIFQALSQALENTGGSLKGAVGGDSLNDTRILPETLSTEESILAAYDIREDDARMRKQLAGLHGHALAEQFDLLRKNYPVRREFHNYIVKNDCSEKNDQACSRQSLKEKLQLGFSVSINEK